MDTLVNQTSYLQDAEFAVIGHAPNHGAGIISFHTEKKSAEQTVKNLKRLGGDVKAVPSPEGRLSNADVKYVTNLITTRSYTHAG